MTKIKFFKVQDGYIGFECSGHTGYAKSGKDILCAAISSITQSCVMGITKVLNVNAKVTKDDDSGYLKIELPKDLDKEIYSKSQVLLQTLYISILDLMEGYSKYISMEVIENDY